MAPNAVLEYFKYHLKCCVKNARICRFPVSGVTSDYVFSKILSAADLQTPDPTSGWKKLKKYQMRKVQNIFQASKAPENTLIYLLFHFLLQF